MLSLNVPGTSWAHSMPVGVKFLFLIVLSVTLFWLSQLWIYGVLAVVVFLLYLSVSGRFLRQGIKLLHPILWVVLIILVFHIFRKDYYSGAVISARLFVLVALANFVTMTSRLSDIIDLFTWITRPLALFGVRSDLCAMAFAMVMRFTPIFIKNAQLLGQAWRARGGRSFSWHIVLPLFITVVDDAENISQAMRARML